jgi:hypothetical protein
MTKHVTNAHLKIGKISQRGWGLTPLKNIVHYGVILIGSVTWGRSHHKVT